MGRWELSGNKTNWQGYVLQLLNETSSKASGFATALLCESCPACGLCCLSVFVNCKQVLKHYPDKGWIHFILVP